MTIKIEKGIPFIPNNTEILRLMEVGDSIAVPRDQAPSFRTLVYNKSAGADRKYATRREADGYRIWRLA